jgi:hypothetical protein
MPLYLLFPQRKQQKKMKGMNRKVKTRGIQTQAVLIRKFFGLAFLCTCMFGTFRAILLSERRAHMDLDQWISPKYQNNQRIDLKEIPDVDVGNDITKPKRKEMASKNVEIVHKRSTYQIQTQKPIISRGKQYDDIKQNEKRSSYLTMYGEHRVKPALDQLPKWLTDYFAWHKVQVANATTKNQTKYLVVTCIGSDICGGFSDRIRAIPFYLLLASKVDRVLCIYWSKPFGLEHLLTPPMGGMDWRCPAEFDTKVDKFSSSYFQKKFQHYRLFGNHKKDKPVLKEVETVISEMKRNKDAYASIGLLDQDFAKITKLNNLFNLYSYRGRYPVNSKWFHVDLSEHVYRVMFEPVEPIAQMINATMARLGLVENNYTSVHVRARYPTKRMMEMVGKQTVQFHDKGRNNINFEGELKKYLVGVANNALECGSLLEPGNKIFFSSDNVDLNKFILGRPFLSKGTNGSTQWYHPMGAERAEIKHLAAHVHHEGVDRSEFYPIVEDLFIMGGGRCVSHGIGSFGAFAAGLSGNRCRAIHRNYKGVVQKCPNPRSDIILGNVTNDELLFDDEVLDDDGRLGPAAHRFYHKMVKSIVKDAQS